MAATIGHIDAFDETMEQWDTYIERFEHFINANYIKDEKRVSVLLSLIGMRTYGLLRSLFTFERPGDMAFQRIVNELRAHFSPKPLIIACCTICSSFEETLGIL